MKRSERQEGLCVTSRVVFGGSASESGCGFGCVPVQAYFITELICLAVQQTVCVLYNGCWMR